MSSGALARRPLRAFPGDHKKCLAKTLGRSLISYELFRTILCELSAVIKNDGKTLRKAAQCLVPLEAAGDNFQPSTSAADDL